MHDASAKDLKETVRIMLQYQSNVAKPQQQDIDDITSFLESLNGEFEGKKLQYSPSIKSAVDFQHVFKRHKNSPHFFI